MLTSVHAENENATNLQQLYAEMQTHNLYPLWQVLSTLVTPTPRSAVKTWKWDYASARDYLLRAGHLISAEKAERRVLILENPGLPGSSSITTSLYAGLQLVLPNEVAPCHRHTACALRFIMEGNGAYTSVDGEKVMMKTFDLVLTPNWQWHDHGNQSEEPMIWLDGLDIPTIRHFDASFAEHWNEPSHPTTAQPGDSTARYGHNMRPMRGSSADRRPGAQPLFHYPYATWSNALSELAKTAAPDPHFGHALEFLNPADGGSIMPTVSAHVRLLPAGFESAPRRSTDATVFVVVRGHGRAHIDDEEVDLDERDVFVIPSWRQIRLKAVSELVLFGYSDRAAQERLGLFREARL